MDRKISCIVIVSVTTLLLVPKSRKFIFSIIKAIVSSKSNNIDLNDDKISSVLEQIISDFKTNAVSYFLYIKAAQNNLPKEQREKIYEKYGKTLATPVIKWYDKFAFLDSEYHLLDEHLEKYLKNKNYTEHQNWISTDRFKEMLLDESNKEAEVIIRNLFD